MSETANPSGVARAAAAAASAPNVASKQARGNYSESVTTIPADLAAFEREYPEFVQKLKENQFCIVMREQNRSQARIKQTNREMFQN